MIGGSPAAHGTVHLVGAGPGDPGLLTLRAATLLSTCSFVAYDRLVEAATLTLIPPTAERTQVGKDAGGGWSQQDVNQLLVSAARAGHAVVRLKGGDPYVFGRGTEEVAACVAAGLPVEVVPGASSAVAGPAAAGIPVTHRGVAAGFAVVTGHEDPADPGSQLDHGVLAAFPGTLVFLMGLRAVGRIAAGLLAHGRPPDTPVAVVASATTDRQEVLEADLASVADAVERSGLRGPATIVVGDVVRLRSLARTLAAAAATA
ncbi:MAG TPA: uroporphyrinogen-III C-methyltransferase [Nitriliruptorales bacterium]|nr:uroporphyrinogen-III C-methyltransferase [Nitriliruptorales bacterium]